MYQAGAIDNYAAAYALTGEPRWLATAQLVRGFVDRFMTSPERGLLRDDGRRSRTPTTRASRCVSGHDYYAKDDAGAARARDPARRHARVRARERPRHRRVRHPRAGRARPDRDRRGRARGGARSWRRTRRSSGESRTRDADDVRVLYLADNAAFGFALMRLYEATRNPAYLESAKRIAGFMLRELQDPAGGFFASTPDPTAVGVLAARRKPFEENVMAVRFLARLSRVAPSDAYRSAIGRALAVVGTQRGHRRPRPHARRPAPRPRREPGTCAGFHGPRDPSAERPALVADEPPSSTASPHERRDAPRLRAVRRCVAHVRDRGVRSFAVGRGVEARIRGAGVGGRRSGVSGDSNRRTASGLRRRPAAGRATSRSSPGVGEVRAADERR